MVRNDVSLYPWIKMSKETTNNLGMTTFTENMESFLPNTEQSSSEFEIWFDNKIKASDMAVSYGYTTLPPELMLFHEVTVPKFSALLLNVMNNIQFNLVTLDEGENYFNISDHNAYIGMPEVP